MRAELHSTSCIGQAIGREGGREAGRDPDRVGDDMDLEAPDFGPFLSRSGLYISEMHVLYEIHA